MEGSYVWSCEAIGRNLYYCPIRALRSDPHVKVTSWLHTGLSSLLTLTGYQKEMVLKLGANLPTDRRGRQLIKSTPSGLIYGSNKVWMSQP
jgi:hypothetical protein